MNENIKPQLIEILGAGTLLFYEPYVIDLMLIIFQIYRTVQRS